MVRVFTISEFSKMMIEFNYFYELIVKITLSMRKIMINNIIYKCKNRVVLLILCSLGIASIGHSQLKISPPEFDGSTDITIDFDATLGNAALLDYEGDVYMHTGIIQGTVLSPTGWNYVQGNWGKTDAKVKMERTGPNTYRKVLNISSFYGIAASEEILQIACVFRDGEGKIVAKSLDDKDLYFPDLEKLEHGKIEKIRQPNGQKFGSIKSVRHAEDGETIILEGEDQILTIGIKQRGIVNFKAFPKKEILDESSYADILDSRLPLTYVESINTIEVDLMDSYLIKIFKNQLLIEISKNGNPIWTLKDSPNYIEDYEGAGPFTFLSMDLQEDEHIYGLGSRAMADDRVGRRLYVYNKPNYNYVYGEDDVYLSLPVYHSSKGYAFFLDSYKKSVFDFGNTYKELIEVGAKDDNLSFYVILGEDPTQLTYRYHRLTGFQELPPLWALGYFQSRYGYKSQAEVEDIVERTIKAGYPLDAVVLDLYWFGGTKRMGDLDWDRDSFPDPDGLINKFDKKGVKTILITESYVVEGTRYFSELDKLGYFAKNEAGESYVIKSFWVGPSALIDVFVPGVGEWLWQIYKREFDRGAAAWWCDSGEPENHPHDMIHINGTAEEIHNAYALQWAKIFYDNFRMDYPDKRLINLTRSGYPGMQRYNAVPWSGDVSRSWSALSAQPNIMIGTSLSGVPYIHHDIGGFTGTELDEELYLRWIQMGTFSPVMRVHGDGHMLAPEPIFYSESVQELVRKYIQMRYTFLPYNYSLAEEVATEGKGFVRAMHYHYPEDEIADTLNNGQYLWGENILVAPIIEKGSLNKRIYFAGDSWYDFHSNKRVKGEKWVTAYNSDSEMPIYIKSGSFIPLLNKQIQNTGEYNPGDIVIQYYLDESDSQSSLYVDDGNTHISSTKYEFAEFEFSKVEDRKWIRLEAKKSSGNLNIDADNWKMELIGFDADLDCIKVNGKKVKKGRDYTYDLGLKKWILDLPDGVSEFRIDIRK